MVRISVVLAALAAPPCLAQSGHAHDPSHQHAIPEIIVTADPLSRIDAHFAAPTTVLDRDALRFESTRSIGETVARQPGVTSSDFGASVGRPVIRGLGGGRVRVLENGLGTFDLSTVSADHPVAIESVFAEQVEILRGPATLLYGSGASGGLVNVVNRRINHTLPDGVEAGLYGHYDTASDGWQGAFEVDAAAGSHLALHLDGLARDSGDLDIPGYATTTPDADERRGTLANSDAVSDNLAFGVSLVGSRGHLGLSVATLASDYGVPGGHGHEEEEDHDDDDHDEEVHTDEHDGTRIDLAQTRWDLDAAWRVEAAGIHRLSARWGYNDYEHDEVEANGEVATRFTNREWEARIEAVLEPLGPFDTALGVQLHDKDFAAVGEEAFVPPATRDSIAVFAFEKAEFGRLHVDFGLRHEWQDADASVPAVSADHALLSFSAGAVFAWRPEQDLGIAVSRAERAPTIEELFAAGPHLATNTFEIGDAGLGEETSTNVDLFWRGRIGRVRLDATLFYNAIDDFVYLAANDRNADGVADRVEDDFLDTGLVVDEDDALLLVNQRQQDAEFYGFELAAELALFDDTRGQLDWRVWSDYVHGELDDGSAVPRLPPLRFGTDVDYARGPLYARFSVERVTDQDDPGLLESATDGYTLVGLQVGYTLTPGAGTEVTVFARGSNLANETARRHTSFVKDLAPLPGRSGLLGVRVSY